MNVLTTKDFPQFFEDLHRTSPFPWQRRLARLVCDDGESPWPRQIALPTASGKTACIDIALFGLACAASKEQFRAPRRIFFVVDRRIIVDQAYERAKFIREKLLSPDTPSLRAVAENLRELARGPHDEDPAPLECFQLRGGVYRDDGWARSPLQPMVVCSTVDQLGSRILFRGYGRSPKVWPVYAGLAANDSLVLLDEAHCSVPFAETIDAVRRYRGLKWAEAPLDAPFSVSVMSATLRCNEEAPFDLEADDYADPRLGPRLLSDKLARLADEVKAKTGTRAFAEALVKEAYSLADRGAKRIAIMVNRVQTAKHAFDLLKDVSRGQKELFIGRMRPLDSNRVVAAWEDRLRSNPERPSSTEPIFIVATQCLEVGADFDFDGLVCECASLDALRQRFGRLKRLGLGDCWATIMISADDAKGKVEDPIYGSALAATWRWLIEHPRADGEDDAPCVNMGVDAMGRLLSSVSPDELDRLVAVARHAPVLLPAHLDRWVQTSPVPEPNPDVSIFLHGNKRSTAEVQVCWRDDLDVDSKDLYQIDADRRDRWIRALSLCPPAAAECMPVPLWLARRWLAGVKIEKTLLSDVDGSSVENDAPDAELRFFSALRWCGPEDEDTELFSAPEDVRPGDTIVVPAKFGRWSDLGHIPRIDMDEPPPDLGDEANYIARHRPVLRLYPTAPRSWLLGCESIDEQQFQTASLKLVDLPPENDLVELFSDKDWRDGLQENLQIIGSVSGVPEWFREVTLALSAETARIGTVHIHPSPQKAADGMTAAGLILVGRRLRGGRSSSGDTFTSEDETSTATADVLLGRHLLGVADMAEHFAIGCQLMPKLQESFKLAGRLHDLGKLDIRFQAWLHSGRVADALIAPEPLAKSRGRTDRKSREDARKMSGYPRGGRHELLSLQLAETCGKDLLNGDVDRDLVLHLVASHHGHCRPFAPYISDKEPSGVFWEGDGLKVELSENERRAWNPARLDSGIADRFWRLVRRYGWWGLAWLESIFILADWRESEREMEGTADE